MSIYFLRINHSEKSWQHCSFVKENGIQNIRVFRGVSSTKKFSRFSVKEEMVFLMVFDSNARLQFFLYVLSNNTSSSTTKHDIQITAFAIRRRRSESDGGSLFFVRPHNAISLDLMNNEQRSSVCKAVFEMYSGYK